MAIGLASAAAAVLAAELITRRLVDAALIESELSRLLGPTWAISVGDAHATLNGTRLSVTEARLVRSGGTADSLSVSAAMVALEGVDLWTAISRRGLALDHLRMEGPEVSMPAVQGDPHRTGDPVSTCAQMLAKLPRLACRHIDVEAASLKLRLADGDLEFHGIDIMATDADVSTSTLYALDRTLYCRGIELTAPAQRGQLGLYAWILGAVRLSTREGMLTVDSLVVAPAVSGQEFRRQQKHRANRYELACGPLRARLAQLQLPPAPMRLRLSSARLSDLQVSIYSDRTLPLLPNRPPARMPHELFRGLGAEVGIDSLEIAGGCVRYSERSDVGGEVGTVEFTDLQATINNLASDISVAADTQRTTLDIRTRLFDKTPLNVHIEYDLQAEDLDVDATGSLRGPLSASAFNVVLSPLEGVRLSSGTLDSLRFAIHLGPERADGQLTIRFHDLGIRTGEKRDQGPFHGLKVLVVNIFKLNSDTHSSPNTANTFPLAYRRHLHDAFFKYLWASVLSGLLLSLGL